MTLTTMFAPAGPPAAPSAVLNLDTALIGPDLLMDTDRQGRISLFHLVNGHASGMGAFRSVADAWHAVDEIDCEEC